MKRRVSIDVFSTSDKEEIFSLASKLIGTSYVINRKKSILLSNILKRMNATGYLNTREYLHFATCNPHEKKHLISSLTIHTTSWFREKIQFDRLERLILERRRYYKDKELLISSIPCSSGEEAYSLAVYFSEFQKKGLIKDFHIHGFDIDSISVEHAKRGVYRKLHWHQIQSKFHRYFKIGSGPTQDFFTVQESLKSKITFRENDVNQFIQDPDIYDIIVCRNMLIYFSQDDVQRIVQGLDQKISDSGLLCLGNSESIETKGSRLSRISNAIYNTNTEKVSRQEEFDILILGKKDSKSEFIEEYLNKNNESCKLFESIADIPQHFKCKLITLRPQETLSHVDVTCISGQYVHIHS